MKSIRHLIALVAATVAVALLLIAAGLANGPQRDGRAEASTVQVPTPSAAEVQRADFSILRRERTKDDEISAFVAPSVRQLAQDGADLSDARAIATPYGRGWLVPAAAKGKLCIVIPDRVDGFGVSCQTTAAASSGTLAATMSSGPGQPPDGELVAVVPDGSTAVLATPGGARQTLKPVDSVISARSPVRGDLVVSTRNGDASPHAVGPEPEGHTYQQCDDGRVVELKSFKVPSGC